MREQIKIEHGIPISKSLHNGVWITTAKKMKPGDSFVIPTNKRQAAASALSKLGFEYVSRKITSNSIRIWRTK